MRVPGVSAYCHDAAAALVVDGAIAVREERSTRIEHAPAFAVNTIRACLDMVGRHPRPRDLDFDFVTCCDKPPLKFARRPALSDAQAALFGIDELNVARASIPAVTHVDRPIVRAPADAYRCFMGTHIDVLAVGNCFPRQADQPVALATRYAAGFSLD